jgi:hypothetical protein
MYDPFDLGDSMHLRIATFLLTCSFAPALAQQPKPPPRPTPATVKPPPPPPSTGKEMPVKGPPRLTLRDHQAVMVSALAQAKKPNPRCDVIANPKVATAWFALPVPPKAAMAADVDAYVAIARCAEAQQFYKLEKDIGFYLVESGTGRYEIEARGWIGLGNQQTAIGVLKSGLKKTPKDPNLLVTAAKVACAMDDWAGCTKFATSALKEAGALPAQEKIGTSGRALKYLARSALHLGTLAKAQKFAAEAAKLGIDQADIAEIKAFITQAELNKVLVEPKFDADLPLGLYHLYGKLGRLGAVQITNLDAGDAQYKVEASIDGVTQKAVQNVTLGKNKAKWVDISPPLAAGFDITKVRAAQPTQLMVKVTATSKSGQRVVYEEGIKMTLQPRDFLPTVEAKGKDASKNTLWAVAAWITPNAKAVDTFLQKAKARAPRQTFSGEQSATLEQVKAIYEELQAQGMSYVMDPYIFENGALHGQRTRLPSEILSTTNAQCLEGTLLYATLFEAIGLKPVVVVVPGHAFVGWHASPKDKEKMFFLETTATHDAKFEDAVRFATDEFAEHDKAKKANVLDVSALRKAGISPQPVE